MNSQARSRNPSSFSCSPQLHSSIYYLANGKLMRLQLMRPRHNRTGHDKLSPISSPQLLRHQLPECGRHNVQTTLTRDGSDRGLLGALSCGRFQLAVVYYHRRPPSLAACLRFMDDFHMEGPALWRKLAAAVGRYGSSWERFPTPASHTKTDRTEWMNNSTFHSSTLSFFHPSSSGALKTRGASPLRTRQSVDPR